MAKKQFKNIKLEQDELKPITIGVFESRKKSSIGIFLILTTLILVVFFLPDISKIVESYLNKTPENPTIPTTPIEPVVPNEGEGENNNDTFYAYTENLKIKREDITLSDFVINNTSNSITYNITNNLSNYQDIEELNYYLEIYNSEQTLIERVKLTTELKLISGAFKSVTRNISSDSATNTGYLVLIKKTTNDYPNYELVNSDNGNGTIVCTKENEKVTYKFTDNKLKELTSELTYVTTNIDYIDKYANDKLLSNTYNNKTGIVSTLFEYEGGYNITTNVNLEEAERLYIFNADSFKLNTEPKVIKFEMEAQRFTCN